MTAFAWIGFLLFVLALLALDLGVFHRHAHAIGVREALGWSAFWIALALVFNAGVWWMYGGHLFGLGSATGLTGGEAALQFLTGYIVEKSLSLDNIFVIALIFGHFAIPRAHQHRVLFWGILGALVLRGAMIGGGLALLARFEWVIYLFGAFLVFTAIKMWFSGEHARSPGHSPLVRLVRRFVPVSHDTSTSNFFLHEGGRVVVTSQFLALVLVESSDVIFAVDSIPAIFAITRDPFIVFTSNVFAILGLRSLYFALAAVIERFRYLKQSLVALLGTVGVKMLISHYVHVPAWMSLLIIVGIIVTGIAASLLAAPGRTNA